VQFNLENSDGEIADQIVVALGDRLVGVLVSLMRHAHEANLLPDNDDALFWRKRKAPSGTTSKHQKCCLCGGHYDGYGNDSAPLGSGKCCDECNTNKVIPAQLKQLRLFERQGRR
jgi:hypothetical protein